MENFFKINSLPKKLQRTMERGDDTAEPSKKHWGFESEQEDRLSSLPDSLLLHVLSFLPMEDAVKTVLLERFGNLWTSVQNLDFDGRSYKNFSNARRTRWFKEFVDHVVLFHRCPTIFRFSLKFGSYLYFLPKTVRFSPQSHNRKPLKQEFSNNIDSWICFAVEKKVKVLDLGILAHESSSSRFDYDLPDTVLTCDSLVELKLVNIGLGEPPKQVFMKSLKKLSLTTILLGDTMIEGILSGCPSLESLFLIKCYGLHKLNCTSIHLKNLMVDIGEYALPYGLEISGPNLTSLHISGALQSVALRNVSSLVEVTLDLCSGCTFDGKYSYSNTGIILEKLHHANVFTISNWFVLVLSLWELAKIPCPSSSHKSIVLMTMLTKWHFPGITTLLRSSPHLEILSIYIEADAMATDTFNDLQIGIPGTYENFQRKMLPFCAYAFNEEEYLNLQPPFRNLLKTVKIFACFSSPYLLNLVKFLLRCSNVLEEMVISIKWNGESSQPSQSVSKELLEFSQKLSRFPKASDHAVILVS